MSWQTYVDEHLMCDIDGGGQHLTAAAIVGLDGSIWAKSTSFPEVSFFYFFFLIYIFIIIKIKLWHVCPYQLQADEVSNINKDFDSPGHLAPTGLHLGGTKYMVIQGEPGAVIRGKKGSGGITIKKTGQALVFGLYEEPVTPGQCNMVVERLGDYLVDQGL